MADGSWSRERYAPISRVIAFAPVLAENHVRAYL
jgi:hypothetical protein